MRRTLCSLSVVLAACAVEPVELFPDGGVVVRADVPASADDAATPADDATTPAADAEPTRDDAAEPARDAELPDRGGFDDATSPDATEPLDMGTAPACTCRFPLCRTDPDCEARIGAGSRCVGTYCTGAVGSCRTDRECPSNLVCVTGPNSTTACP